MNQCIKVNCAYIPVFFQIYNLLVSTKILTDETHQNAATTDFNLLKTLF